ncbi:MAG: hypothetical protein ABSA75_15345 [Candidatus Bathyarchaeia archaeon]
MTECSECGGKLIENDQEIPLFCANCGTIMTKDPRTIKLLEYDKKQVTELQKKLRSLMPKGMIEKAPIKSHEYVFTGFHYRKNYFSPHDYMFVTEEKLVMLLNNKLHAIPLENIVTINPPKVFNNGQIFQITIDTFEGKIIFGADGVLPKTTPILNRDTSEYVKYAQHALELKLKNEEDYESTIWKTTLQKTKTTPSLQIITAQPEKSMVKMVSKKR